MATAPYPCSFDHVVRELETMAGTDVNAIVETSFNSHREPADLLGYEVDLGPSVS